MPLVDTYSDDGFRLANADTPEERSAAARRLRERRAEKDRLDRLEAQGDLTVEEAEENLYEELRKLRPQALKILRQGLKVDDVKVKHESMKLVMRMIEDLDPRKHDEPAVVRYETAALPPDGWKPELRDFKPAPLS